MKNLERLTGKAVRLAAFLFLFTGYPLTALAGIEISPVLLEMSEQQDKQVVRVGNSSETAKSFQVDVVAWSQSGDEREIYTPTSELLAVPPLFTLQPGEQQVVRIGLMREPDADQELSYRVFFTELEPPQMEEKTTSGISIRLRFGVPVFVAPLAPASAAIEFVALRTIDNNTFMELRNTGNVRVKVNEVRYQAPTSLDKEVSQAVLYLHSGKTGFLPLEVAGQNVGGTVELVTDTAGIVEYALSGPQ
jgi:fimbrial chaperone protein